MGGAADIDYDLLAFLDIPFPTRGADHASASPSTYEAGGNTPPPHSHASNIRCGSINVTVLNKARLGEIIQCALDNDLDVVVLSETRHHTEGMTWAKTNLKKFHWNCRFSEPPPLNRANVVRQGGTAVLWKRVLGRCSPIYAQTSETHRSIGTRFATFGIISVYGHASHADTDWLSSILRSAPTDVPVLLLGDLNWKPKLNDCIVLPWIPSTPTPTTTANTTPTRAIFTAGSEVTSLGCQFLPGINYHGLWNLVFSFHAPTSADKAKPMLRPHVCANYAWKNDDAYLDIWHPIVAQINDELPRPPPVDTSLSAIPLAHALQKHWQSWHKRAERAWQLAVETDLATCSQKSEREKGSKLTLRPQARGAAHRAPQTIVERRLRRLHRAVAERVRQHTPLDAKLNFSDGNRFHRAMTDGILPLLHDVPTIGESLDIISRALKKHNDEQCQVQTGNFARQFSRWNNDIWKPASCVLKPQTLFPQFTATQMADDWSKVWCPPDHDATHVCDAWRDFADSTSLPQPPSGNTTTWAPETTATTVPAPETNPAPTTPASDHHFPDYFDFHNACLTCHGSCGDDGWLASELKDIVRFMPFLADELYELWLATTKSAVTLLSHLRSNDTDNHVIIELIDYVWIWRTVGICKKTDMDSRPISVGSVLVRSWHRSLHKLFPPPSASQWAGRHKTSVLQATAHWLSAPKVAGHELDLKAAYDSVTIDLAYTANVRRGISTDIAATLALAWKAARICTVQSERADPIHPVCGLPQGDPCAGDSLESVLAPWNSIIEDKVPDVRIWSFVDDRTTAQTEDIPATQSPLEYAMQLTKDFDAAAHLTENLSKLQCWDESTDCTIEHLGLVVHPTNANHPILPRAGWEKAEVMIANLSRCPGTMAVRERLAMAFIRPQFAWASPLLALPPKNYADQLRRSIIKTRCTWWCPARWWAERIALHPRYGTAILGLKTAKTLVNYPSEHLDNSVNMLALQLGFRLVAINAAEGIVLTGGRTTHPQVLESIGNARLADEMMHRPHYWFDPSTAAGQHVLRLAARRLLLNTIATGRNDREGNHLIDLAAQSDSNWRKWCNSLDDLHQCLLAIWRGGAIFTPTRRHSGAQGNNHQPRLGSTAAELCCPYCPEQLCSARHWWTNCPRFNNSRRRLCEEHELDNAWWNAAWRVTSTSGWVTTDVSRNRRTRVAMQIAACKLGIEIIRTHMTRDNTTSP